MGPVEYVVIEFPSGRFESGWLPALAELVERGTVAVIDLVYVTKGSDGTVTSFEFDELDDLSDLAAIDGDADGVMNDEDIRLLAEPLTPGSAALFLLLEDLWASDFAAAVVSAGGRLLAGERIPNDELESVIAGLDAE
jgi:hypothetical protein